MGKIIVICVGICLLSLSAVTERYAPPILQPSNIAYSADGRLVIAWNAKLWLAVVDAGKDGLLKSDWRQITFGTSEERDPVWMPDGKSLVFSSDRAGQFDLWQISLPKLDPVGDPTLLIQSPQADIQASIAKDGTMFWVRGLGADADIWLKKPGNGPTQLTSILGPDHSPAIHPDGQQLLYISERKGSQQLQLMNLLDKRKKRSLPVARTALSPQWSPDGRQITYATRNQPVGLWVTDQEGSYNNLLSTARSIGVWASDGSHLVLLEMPRNPPSYNGDPQKGGLRRIQQASWQEVQLSIIPAPIPPDQKQKNTRFNIPAVDLPLLLAQFDQRVAYLDQRYGLAAGENGEQWNQLVSQCRKDLAKAKKQEEAEAILYQLIHERPPLKKEATGKAGISSAHPLATAAGLSILENGGNVVDAAVAISFALGVVEPDASGVGGYGEMLIYLEGMAAPTSIEFLTRVPEAASLANGQLQSLPSSGPVLVNVPGTVAGMELAWQKYGSKKVPWADLLAPAIALAREGFVIDASFATTLDTEKEAYAKCEPCQSLFFKNGQPLQAGDTLRNPDLAWTLSMIASRGRDGFYKGPVAQRMVEDLRGKGNVMSLEDLARYYAVERPPVQTTYRDHTIYSGPPPVSGGALLTAKLNLLDGFKSPQPYTSDVATLHAMIEAWKLSPSTSGRLADPGLWPVDLTPFTDKPFADARWLSCFNPAQSVNPNDSACIDTRVAASWGAEGVLEARSSTGTTAFAVADAQGNMVSVTQTLGTWGGNFYVSPGLGFLYNDKLGSYGTNPQRYNARIPFARNVTSISPSMIFKGTKETKVPYVALGAAGNAWINSAVYQMTSGIVDQGLGPQAALELPRFLVGMQRDVNNRQKVKEIVIQLEDGFAPGVLQQLQFLGHELQLISAPGELRMGYGAAVMVEKGSVRAGADPRRSGEAGAVEE